MMKIKAITDNPKFHIMPFFYPSLSQKRTRAAFLSVLRMSPVCTIERGALPTLSLMLECAADDLRANARAEIGVAHPAINVLREARLRAHNKTPTENAPRDYT